MRKRKADRLDVQDRIFGLVAALAVSPLFFLFAVRGEPARGRAAALSAVFALIVIRFPWDLRKHLWFWITMACFVGVHVAVVLLVDWQEKSYPGFTLLPIGIADFGVMYGIVKLVERFRTSQSDPGQKP